MSGTRPTATVNSPTSFATTHPQREESLFRRIGNATASIFRNSSVQIANTPPEIDQEQQPPQNVFQLLLTEQEISDISSVLYASYGMTSTEKTNFLNSWNIFRKRTCVSEPSQDDRQALNELKNLFLLFVAKHPMNFSTVWTPDTRSSPRPWEENLSNFMRDTLREREQ